MKSVLVLAAHPDDELLGVGGTILRHIDRGDVVRIHIACTKGLRDRDRRLHEAQTVAGKIGASVTFGNQKQLGYSVPEALSADIIYSHWHGDLNRDHRLVAEAALVGGREAQAVYLFETPSSTEWGMSSFTAQRFVSIDIDAKLALLGTYADELRDFPHPRSPAAIFALAKWRGSTAGLDAAEAFHVVRERW